MKSLSQTKRPAKLEADAATRAKIEVLMLRDGLDLETFLARATESYALMMPGWPYPATRR